MMAESSLTALTLLKAPHDFPLRVPSDFYTVVARPAPIAGMPRPFGKEFPWQAIYDWGFRHVICLESSNPGYNPSPLRMAQKIHLQDLAGGIKPRDPPREERLIRVTVAVALDKIRANAGVVLHCLGGTGRTGTVLGCLLRVLGYEGPKVLEYLDVLNKARGQGGWPESSWQSELVLRFV